MLFKNSVRTSKRTPHFTITKINWLTLFKEIIYVYTENHTKQSKAVPLHAKVALGGRGGIASTHSWPWLDGGEWSASRLGRALSPGKGPPLPIVQEAGWASESVWTHKLEEKSFAPAGDRTPIARSSSPYSDTILTELPVSPESHTESINTKYSLTYS
jgi:hypothetical protein